MLMTNFHIGMEQVAEFQIALTLLSNAIRFRFATLELHILGATVVDEMRVGLIFLADATCGQGYSDLQAMK